MGWDFLAYKSYLFSVSCKVGSHNRTTGRRNIKLEVIFKVQKMARYASFCFIMDPFNHFTAHMLNFSGTQENTTCFSAGIIWHICTTYSAPPGVLHIAGRGVSN